MSRFSQYTVRLKKLPILVLYYVVVVVVWQLVVSFTGIPSYVVPSPLDTAASLARYNSYLFTSSLTTVYETMTGFAIGSALAIGLAVAMAYFASVKTALYPLVAAFQSIPKAAIAPLFIIWFGIGLYSKTMMALVICFFPVLVNTLSGLERVEPDYVELLTGMKATRTKIFLKLRLPNSLPYMFDGFKIGIPLAVVGAIIGELVASTTGLGYVIDSAGNTLNMPLMFAALIYATVWSAVLFALVFLMEKLVIRWEAERK